MKIIFVAHGNDPIPPTGWGAVEQVIWQTTIRLRPQGHEICIVNKKRYPAIFDVIRETLKGGTDVIHCHAEKPVLVLSWWVKYLNRRRRDSKPIILVSTTHNPLNPLNLVFSERKALRRCNFAPYHLVIRNDAIPLIQKRNPKAICVQHPNAVECKEFDIQPKGNGRACFVGRIQERKRQNDTALLLKGSGLECDFIGPLREEVTMSDELKNRLLGEWDRETLHRRLTEYSCLIIMSVSEAQPLVIVEALSAGLPVVVSRACSENLDHSLPFVHVVDRDDQLVDMVRTAISQRDPMHKEIRAYVEANFDYDATVQRYLNQVIKWQDAHKVQ